MTALAAALLVFFLLTAPHWVCAPCVSIASAQPPPEVAETPPAAGAEAAGEQEGATVEEVPEEAVIPTGQEDMLVDMLGKGATFPGPCKLTGAQVDHSIIVSTYGCPAGDVVFELCHPSVAARGAVQTAQFAISLKSGTPPEGLKDALVERVRSKEAAFHWKWLGSPGAPRRSRLILVLVAAGVLGGGALAWALLRRRS